MKQNGLSEKPAVFFDRDGVLNVDNGYNFRKEDFVWVVGAREAIKLLNDLDYYVFVITNQSGVARGYYTEDDVIKLHDWMNEELKKSGATIDGFYYCPHLPEAAVEKYRICCQCRKPAPGMIMQAMNDWPVDKGKSFLIGDSVRDVEAAEKAGIEGYLFQEDNLLFSIKQLLKTKKLK